MNWKRHIRRTVGYDSAISNEGLTLIESLVAIVIIGITVASIGPVLIISSATRVQSQRAEQALRIAQGEIDRVRQIVDQGVVDTTPPGSTVTTTREYKAADLLIASTPSNITNAVNAAVPNAVATDFNASNYQVARQIDVNNDSTPDFAVQAYRLGASEHYSASDPNRPLAFEMGVRVYEYDAVNDAVTNSGDLESTPARLGTAGGVGDRDKRPLAVLYTEIIRSDETRSLCEFFEYKGSTPAALEC